MPNNYTLLDKTTNEEYDVTMSYDDFVALLEFDKNIQQVFRPLNYAYRIGGLKVSEAWRSRLKAMKKANPRSTIQIP
jgi:hypothetical protein